MVKVSDLLCVFYQTDNRSQRDSTRGWEDAWSNHTHGIELDRLLCESTHFRQKTRLAAVFLFDSANYNKTNQFRRTSSELEQVLVGIDDSSWLSGCPAASRQTHVGRRKVFRLNGLPVLCLIMFIMLTKTTPQTSTRSAARHWPTEGIPTPLLTASCVRGVAGRWWPL